MTTAPIKAIIFDIDGTLAPGISWVKLTQDLGVSVAEHDRIFQEYLAGTIDYPTSKVQLIGLWNSSGKAAKQSIEAIFRSWEPYPEAQAVIKQLQKHYVVCLITGSMDLYAQTVAEKLGVKHWYANTPLVWGADNTLIDYHHESDQAARKLADLQDFCAKQGISPSECVTVGDGENDVELFKACRHGIVIADADPPAILKPYAWHTVPTLATIPDLLQ